MLILLPPSEGKAPPARRGRPVDLAALSFPELVRTRSEILAAVVAAAEPASNARLVGQPATAVAGVYAGVLYDALDYPGLTVGAKRRANRSVLVQSALWGPVGLADRISPYRLPMDATVPGIGGLAARWRSVLDPVLTTRAGSGVVVDCRSAPYATAWRPTGDVARRTVAVRVFTETAGRRTVVSHFAKHTRGLVTRWLLESPTPVSSVGAVARTVARHAPCDLVDLGPRGWALDVLS